MKTCPRCGYYNPDTAVSCGQCDRELLASDNAVAPPSRMAGHRVSESELYLLGIGLGLIPLALWLVGWAGACREAYGYLPTSGPGQDRIAEAMWLYGLQLVAVLVCQFSRRTRPVGDGLLTMALVDPVAGLIGCSVIASGSARPC